MSPQSGIVTQQGIVRLTIQIESIQRQAAISIAGVMSTTAGDAAIVHANIVGIWGFICECSVHRLSEDRLNGYPSGI